MKKKKNKIDNYAINLNKNINDVVDKEALCDALLDDFHSDFADFTFGFMEMTDVNQDKLYVAMEDLVWNFDDKLNEDDNYNNYERKRLHLVNFLKGLKFDVREIETVFYFVGRLSQLSATLDIIEDVSENKD